MLLWLLLLAAKLPPIHSANDAVLQLKTGSAAAVANVGAACRGKLRHALKDDPRVTAELSRLAASGSPEVKKAVLDAHRCLSPAKWVAIMTPRLLEPEVAAYAAEVSARVGDPVVVGPLLDRLDERKAACMTADLAAEEVELCVWLTYAPGASLGGADDVLRARAARAAAAMLDSPHAKVREVAVETIASSGIAAHAEDIAGLVAKEKRGAFEEKNDAALIARFEARRRALASRSKPR
jgi:hypothetical protein